MMNSVLDHGIGTHLCVSYEASSANVVVSLDINKAKQAKFIMNNQIWYYEQKRGKATKYPETLKQIATKQQDKTV